MFTAIALVLILAQVGGPFEIPTGGDYVLATIVVGFLMSPIISFLNRASWSSEWKAVGAFGWCFVASLALLIAGNVLGGVPMDLRAWFSTFLVVFVMATGLYQFYFKPSGIGPSIERATG